MLYQFGCGFAKKVFYLRAAYLTLPAAGLL